MERIIISDLSSAAEAEHLIELLDDYARSDTGGGEGLPAYTQEHLVAAIKARPNMHVILAYINDVPAGVVIAIDSFSTFSCKPILNIHDVSVRAQFRGKGLAGRMMTVAEDIARSKGCCKLTLEVLEGNEPAKRAYRALGYDGYELDPAMGKAMFWQKKL
ncbi:GNAT family N-acetyltransferase [Thalassolituus sp. LLYu03]|uniref:GNAT family N-acetyltransferase n=1 Tax=Thalassolituus sp. LLYu03 TaxID=3421656 RepID=UPI003D2E38A1